MAFSHHRAPHLVQSLRELLDTLRRQIQERPLRWRGRCGCIGLWQSSHPALKNRICPHKMTCRCFLKTHGSPFQAVPAPCNSNLAYYDFKMMHEWSFFVSSISMKPPVISSASMANPPDSSGPNPVPLQLWSSLDQIPP